MDKTGNVKLMLDLTISAQKYPKIVTQVKQNHVPTSTVRFGVFLLHMFKCRNQIFDQVQLSLA